jgi:hypothetical protein
VIGYDDVSKTKQIDEQNGGKWGNSNDDIQSVSAKLK